MSEPSLETQVALLSQQAAENNVLLNNIADYVYRGNGKPPLTVRMDRLEQSERNRVRYINIALGTSLTAVITAIWAKVF